MRDVAIFRHFSLFGSTRKHPRTGAGLHWSPNQKRKYYLISAALDLQDMRDLDDVRRFPSYNRACCQSGLGVQLDLQQSSRPLLLGATPTKRIEKCSLF